MRFTPHRRYSRYWFDKSCRCLGPVFQVLWKRRGEKFRYRKEIWG